MSIMDKVLVKIMFIFSIISFLIGLFYDKNLESNIHLIIILCIMSFMVELDRLIEYKIYIILPIIYFMTLIFDYVHRLSIMFQDMVYFLSHQKILLVVVLLIVMQNIILIICFSTIKEKIKNIYKQNYLKLILLIIVIISYSYFEFNLLVAYSLNKTIFVSDYFYKSGCFLFYISLILFSYKFNKKNTNIGGLK